MDLALNNQQQLICPQNKPNQNLLYMHIFVFRISK